VARDLYQQCVEQDPQYAPAWARLARCQYLIAKWTGEDVTRNLAKAEAAFHRALELNPELPIGHKLYAHLEADQGRPKQAMIRLLARARVNSSDPELFSGLVHACRYCGLLEASVAAHEQAARLDPNIITSVGHSYFYLGDYDRAMRASMGDFGYLKGVALGMLNRREEAISILHETEQKFPLAVLRGYPVSLRALLEGRRSESIEAAEATIAAHLRDPEGLFYLGRQFVYLGETARALEILAQSVERGFICFPAFARDRWLDPLRDNPEFVRILGLVEGRYREAVAAFREAGGEQVLGTSS
jgi:tetratricopeptide (TPR) repeat protein